MSRAVPWIDWSEWAAVREQIFSDDRYLISKAIVRIATWRSRGRVPIAVQATAALFEIRLAESARSPTELRMLYSMAMVRMVNGVCDASQKGKSAMSVMSIARRHGLPPMLVDLRHAATHGDLPSLSALQTAAGEAIDWLLARYWTRQDAAAVRGSDKMHGTAKRELLKFLDGFRTAKTAALKQQVERSGSLPPPSPRTSKADKMMAPLVQIAEDPTILSCMLVDTILDDGVIIPKLAVPADDGSGGGAEEGNAGPLYAPEQIDEVFERQLCVWRPVLVLLAQLRADFAENFLVSSVQRLGSEGCAWHDSASSSAAAVQESGDVQLRMGLLTRWLLHLLEPGAQPPAAPVQPRRVVKTGIGALGVPQLHALIKACLSCPNKWVRQVLQRCTGAPFLPAKSDILNPNR